MATRSRCTIFSFFLWAIIVTHQSCSADSTNFPWTDLQGFSKPLCSYRCTFCGTKCCIHHRKWRFDLLTHFRCKRTRWMNDRCSLRRIHSGCCSKSEQFDLYGPPFHQFAQFLPSHYLAKYDDHSCHHPLIIIYHY